MTTRNPYEIGKGEYKVFYKERDTGSNKRFTGVCENFSTGGLSAFWNQEKEQMLLVHYQDILGLYPINQYIKS